MTTLRAMQSSDAIAVAALLPDLGYSASPAEIAARLAALREWPDQEAFVACEGAAVVGFCQVQGVRLLASNGYAEVQALVVAQASQRRGVGSTLLEHAVQWAFGRGYERVRLRSGMHREDAHGFYAQRGFVQSRASLAFERASQPAAGVVKLDA